MKKITSTFVFFLAISFAGYGDTIMTNQTMVAFHVADTNSDGKVTLEEFKRHVKQEFFRQLDRDGDKKIDASEWKGFFPAPKPESNFEEMDKDGDKAVSFLEFSHMIEKHYDYEEIFRALDRNRDGSLAPEEFNARPAFTILSIKF